MLKLFRDQKGFTLVELMIVVVIIGVLAAVAIPMYTGSVKRAKASEAVTALGSIRSAMRVYHAEHGAYNFTGAVAEKSVLIDAAGVEPGGVGYTQPSLDLTSGDLTGRYFDYRCYYFTTIAAESFTIKANGPGGTTMGANAATKADEVLDIARTIDEGGDISKVAVTAQP